MLSLLLSLALAASPPLATVNGVAISQADLDAMVAALPEDVQAQVRDNPGLVLDQLVKTELVRQAAETAKVAETEAGKARIAVAVRQALVAAQLQSVVDERTSPAAVQAWYDAHKAQYAVPEARARHIMLASEADAKKVMEDLKGGADFASLAKERSKDPGSAAQGGELGWFQRETMVPEFGTAVFTAKAGAIVGPVKSQYGWHVIEVEGLRDSVPLEDVADEIKAQMHDQIVDDYIAELEGKATIERSDDTNATLVTPLSSGPDLPTDAPRTGVKGAPFTVVVFLDLQCPHCAAMHVSIDRLLKTRTDVEVVYRHYPINSACNPDVSHTGHEFACVAADAVVCAGKDGTAVMDELLTNGAALTQEVIDNVAAEHGGKGKKWDACMADPKTAARVAADVASGHAMGVEGTPTVYIGTGGKWWLLAGGGDQLGAALDAVKAH